MPLTPIPPSTPQSEALTVAAGAATLTYVPVPESVVIANFVKIYSGTPSAGQYKVTPGSAVLTFNVADNGATPTCTYSCAEAEGVTTDKVNDIIAEVNNMNPSTIITTKGDLIAGDAAGDAARVAVGSNGQVLMADSAQANGVKWANTPSGFQRFLASGNFTVPEGVTKIRAALWGGGGGGGGGAGITTVGPVIANGVAGGNGGDTSILNGDHTAPGGAGGAGGTASAGANGGAGSPDVFNTATYIRYGSNSSVAIKFGGGEVPNGATGNMANGDGGSSPNNNTGGGGGGGGGVFDGVTTTGAGGKGAAGAYGEAYLTVTPGQIIPVTVGAGGTSGDPGVGGDFTGGAGGPGAAGLVIITW